MKLDQVRVYPLGEGCTECEWGGLCKEDYNFRWGTLPPLGEEVGKLVPMLI